MRLLCCILALLSSPVLSLPSTYSLVTSTIPSTTKETDKAEEENGIKTKDLKIYEMHITANVTNRFSHTLISSRVKNFASEAKEASFSVILPETAYISGFVLEIDGKRYEAYVKEKEEAKNIYDEAVQSGLSAAHVTANARDSNRFDVSVNVEPQKKAGFYLSYEELLQRENEQYEVVVNIHPGQLVKDLQVEVNINESRPLRFVKAPSIRSGNEISKYENQDLDSRATITHIDEATTKVIFQPTRERQKELAHSLGTDENQGLAGQFVVQYDVIRERNGGEVLLQDGYFVHFFSPSDVKPLPKQVVFVLDTSGSMYYTKIQQLKQAMYSILGELKENDLFNVVEFNSVVKTWNLEDNTTVVFPKDYSGWGETDQDVERVELPPAFKVNEKTLKKAKSVIDSFDADGGTNIYSALKIALRLVESAADENKANSRQPLIIFLTDGDATVDVTDTERIIREITELNSGKRKAPIFSLSFGDGADKIFLQKLSLNNKGFSRHIYEAADASIQLTDFYSQISSPLLTNVNFKYTPSVSNLTKTVFPIFFGGSELVVSGTVGNDFGALPKVEAFSIDGPIELHPQVSTPVSITHLERLWAYISVKQLLDAREVAQNKTRLEKEALDLALRYSFVTPLTSLVVVKPNGTSKALNAIPADNPLLPSPVFLTSASLPYHGSLRTLISPVYPQMLAGSSGSTHYAQRSFLSTSFRSGGNIIAEDDSFFDAVEAPTTNSEVDQSTNKLQELQNQLPWIASVLNEDEETITLSNGTYSLGINHTVSAELQCPQSPLNQTGICKLLPDCPTAYGDLTDLKIYEQYFCILEGYAGVCCPKPKP